MTTRLLAAVLGTLTFAEISVARADEPPVGSGAAQDDEQTQPTGKRQECADGTKKRNCDDRGGVKDGYQPSRSKSSGQTKDGVKSKDSADDKGKGEKNCGGEKGCQNGKSKPDDSGEDKEMPQDDGKEDKTGDDAGGDGEKSCSGEKE